MHVIKVCTDILKKYQLSLSLFLLFSRTFFYFSKIQSGGGATRAIPFYPTHLSMRLVVISMICCHVEESIFTLNQYISKISRLWMYCNLRHTAPFMCLSSANLHKPMAMGSYAGTIHLNVPLKWCKRFIFLNLFIPMFSSIYLHLK